MDDCYQVTAAEADVNIGITIDPISPPYLFVGASGTLTVNGDNFLDPFDENETTLSLQFNGSGGSGLSYTTGDITSTQATANYTVGLSATTGNWEAGIKYYQGESGSYFDGVTNFTVGDPTPDVTSVDPDTWTAGQTNIPVTISGSYFGSNPQLSVSGGGATATMTSHTDNGQPGGASIHASVSVPASCTGSSATITVTSTGYNGTGFTPAYSGQSDSDTGTATIAASAVALTADAPNILFNTANVAGKTTKVVVGQEISLTGQVPTQACMTVQSWNWTPPTGTAIGGATATTGKGFTLKALPPRTKNPYTFYWPYPGTFTVSTQYTLTNGETSPSSTATFTVKGLSGTPMSTKNYGKLKDNTLTVCDTTTKETVLAYGNISGTTCDNGITGTAGELFTAKGSPGGGTYSFVQLINSDTTTFTSSSGTTTCTHNAGVDFSYPYAAQISATKADDAPFVVLPTSPYNNITRSFSASMYLLWTSSVAGSIPVPAGSVTWQFSGATTLTKGKWGSVTGSGTANAFVAATGTQSNKGYPLWTGPSDQSCN